VPPNQPPKSLPKPREVWIAFVAGSQRSKWRPCVVLAFDATTNTGEIIYGQTVHDDSIDSVLVRGAEARSLGLDGETSFRWTNVEVAKPLHEFRNRINHCSPGLYAKLEALRIRNPK